jgi:transcriptional regulator with PAS, ATPase and Fis domain
METGRRLIGASAAIREIEQEIECAASTDAKVLLTGESGSGKEVVANLIHRDSRRRKAPFVPINCAGVPDSLLESELFGHVRGSFTDAHRDKRGWLDQAQGGTVFLDEIGEMSVRMQAVLLRFLENGEIQRVGAERSHAIVDVRVIAATNRNLLTQVAEKKFREDLYYRLNVIHITIPPLRERQEDIQPLLFHFIQSTSQIHGVPAPGLMDEVLARLLAYAWPGNVRELRNVAERLVVRAQSGMITLADLPKDIAGKWTQPALTAQADGKPALTPERLFERMTVDGESFWSVVYEPFMARDLTRDDLRALIARGLEQTRGSYKLLLPVFNLSPGDYKRLLVFLRKYDCHLPFQKFRSIPIQARSVNRPLSDDNRLIRTG